MFDLEKICKEVESLDPATYASILTEKSVGLVAELSEITENGFNGTALFMGFVLGAVISDGKLAEEEFFILKPSLDLALNSDVSYEEALDIVSDIIPHTKKFERFLDAAADLLGAISEELKNDIVWVCLLICAVDGKISYKEKQWLKQIIK